MYTLHCTVCTYKHVYWLEWLREDVCFILITYNRLDDVESRLQQTAASFDQSRLLARKTKQDFERVKKKRYSIITAMHYMYMYIQVHILRLLSTCTCTSIPAIIYMYMYMYIYFSYYLRVHVHVYVHLFQLLSTCTCTFTPAIMYMYNVYT